MSNQTNTKHKIIKARLVIIVKSVLKSFKLCQQEEQISVDIISISIAIKEQLIFQIIS